MTMSHLRQKKGALAAVSIAALLMAGCAGENTDAPPPPAAETEEAAGAEAAPAASVAQTVTVEDAADLIERVEAFYRDFGE